MKKILFILCSTAIFLLFSGFVAVFADIPVSQDPQTQGIVTSTVLNGQGIVTESDSVAWQLDSDNLHDPPLSDGGLPITFFDADGNPVYGWTADPLLADLLGEPIPPGEVRYTAGYNANIMAVRGTTTLVKTMNINTANKVGNQQNINANTVLSFIAGDGGRATATEDILLDGAGAQTTTANKILCPFTPAEQGPFFPPFCNIIQSGSAVDISAGSVSTQASERFVSASADVPVSQAYSITGQGITQSQGTSPATGSMSAYLKAHLQDGRMFDITPVNPEAIDQPEGFVPGKASDIVYSETSSADGLISRFSKSVWYQSGISLI